MAERHFIFSEHEYQWLMATLENVLEESEELMKELDWYTTEIPDRVEVSLEILRSSEVPF